jgi:hypothetical protein
MWRRLLLSFEIFVALFLPLASHAQTEQVTLLQIRTVSQTSPAPDCSGMGNGAQAGFCAGQRQSAQTPVPWTYYTLTSDRNAYVLSCRAGGLLSPRCPVINPGQQFTLTVVGTQVALRAPGSKDLKLRLVEARAVTPEDRADSATQKPPEAPPLAPSREPSKPESLAASAKLRIESTPPGADIEVDGSFVGSTPSDIQVTEGDHIVAVKKSGFKSWERKLKASADSKAHIAAELEKADQPR